MEYEQPVTFRPFDDPAQIRTKIFDNVQSAVASKFPLANSTLQIDLEDVGYENGRDFDYEEQKQAILNNRPLSWKLKGTYVFRDPSSGQELGRERRVVTRVPWMTPRGTFIHNGVEWTMSHQQRLRPGIYAREKDNGEIESHVNLMPGTGKSFRLFMDAKNGVMRARLGQANIPIYPVLRGLGATDEQMIAAWGREIFEANRDKAEKADLGDVVRKFVGKRAEGVDPEVALREAFDRMRIDPEVSERNLGKAYDRVSAESLTRATQKLLNIHRRIEDMDDRDDQFNRTTLGPEDILAERIAKDADQIQRRLLWKRSRDRDVTKVPHGLLTKQVLGGLMASGLGMPPEQVNPLETFDQMYRVTAMGQGGIPSTQSISDESRNVQASQMGLIDPVKAPESSVIGVDGRLAVGTLKGQDGRLYRTVLDRNGKETVISAQEMGRSKVAFPGEMSRNRPTARVMYKGQIEVVPKEEVDYAIPSGEDMLSPATNLVPMVSGVKGQRASMGARMMTQSVPVLGQEAPLVRSASTDGSGSFEAKYGRVLGAVHASKPGVVQKVTSNGVVVVHEDGTTATYELARNVPHNRKTVLHNTPLVAKGDVVEAGQLLAKSNYTDDKGVTALGTNLRVAFLPMEGTHEDAVLISESAAKKLTGEHLYQKELEIDKNRSISRGAFLSKYPGAYDRRQMDMISDDGVIKPGSTVRRGDPLVLAVDTKRASRGQTLRRHSKSVFRDASLTWEKDAPGVVTDVSVSRSGVKVLVKSYDPMGTADKLSGRYGNKGVVGKILPDDQMPRTEDGTPVEVVFNPLGLISRVNPAQIHEAILGKIARKTGQPYNMPQFTEEDYGDFVEREMQKHQVSDTERVFDPQTNRYLDNILVGEQYIMRLHHSAEGKLGARDTGAYTAEGQPAKGGSAGAKRLGGLDHLGLLAHGATEFIRETHLVRGQKNEDFWRDLQTGRPLTMPRDYSVYGKFLESLQASGIRVNRTPTAVNIAAMTDGDVDELAGDRELKNADGIDARTREPIKGGLFDTTLTGGLGGARFSKITLASPIPHPLMEDPIRRLLGMTVKKYEEEVGSPGGVERIIDRLSRIDIDTEIEKQKDVLRSGAKTKRDGAAKIIRYLHGAKAANIHPKDWVISKIPVLPPRHRPVSVMRDMELTSDANLLYRDLWDVNEGLKKLSGVVDDVGLERLDLYNATKAVFGLSDPVSLEYRQKGVQGILRHLIGKSSPKQGVFQRSLMAAAADSVGRGVISPEPALDMDEIGIPEPMAWKLFRPFVMRKLAQRYNIEAEGGQQIPLIELAKMVANKDPLAKKALQEVMDERVVVASRAPVLHKFGVIGQKPVLVAGNSIRVSPLNIQGMGADHDGDTFTIHAPTTDAAMREIREKMMPSRMLLDEADFDVHLTPRQEFLLGLFLGTKGVEKKSPRQFENIQQVLAAVARGEIGIRDPVDVKGL